MDRKKQELHFSDLVHEVLKLETAKFQHGKESEQYKKQHELSVKIVRELNNTHGHGHASLSSARASIQLAHTRETNDKASALSKTQKSMKSNRR